MAISMNDVSGGKRRIDDVGDPRNFRHTKQYGKYYGARIASGLMALVIIISLMTNILDFFCPLPKRSRKDKQQNDRPSLSMSNHAENKRSHWWSPLTDLFS